MTRTYISLLFLTLFCSSIFSQQAYFVDGYHGGVYGHYPIEWKTRFIVDQFHKHPEWKICMEIEPETWDTVKLKTPEDYLDLKKIITDNRMEFTNPTYAQPYCYNISGESIIRQFEYGIKKTHQHFPELKFTTYSVEEPCFTSCLPQILKSFGFQYAVLKCPNTCWGGYTQAYGGELVNWIGPDGTSILTVPRHAFEDLEDNSSWQTIAWANSEAYLKACIDYGIKHPVGMCFQDAGWRNGPWLGSGDNIKNNSLYTTWTHYIENVSTGKTDDNWHFSQEDMLVSLMWGSQVLQRIGQQVRSAENKIILAEKLNSMAYLENKQPYLQEEMDEAWRTLMLAQHHDSWIVPYNRLNKHRTWADEIALWTGNTNAISDQIINTSIESFNKQSHTSDSQTYIRIYNTLGTYRSELVNLPLPQEYAKTNFAIYNTEKREIPFEVENENGEFRLFFKAEVPPFGYATYTIKKETVKERAISPSRHSNTNEYVLENDMYKIVFDASKGGIIKSLVAKKEGNKEYVAKADEYSLGELRGYFYEEERFHSSKETPARITIVKDNPLIKSIRIEGEIATHPFVQIVTITNDQRRIDFDLKINWKQNVGIGEYKQPRADHNSRRRAFYDDRFKLNVLFPTSLQSPKLYKNAPFDVCESRLDNTFFNTWDSIKHNIILNWVDLAEAGNKHGLALFSDHTTSYSYGENYPLGLTVQYSGQGLWGPDYKINYPTEMKYALLPHQGEWDKSAVAEESLRWNEPLVCAYSANPGLKTKSWIDIQNTGYEISSVQIRENKQILLRLFNAQGDDATHKVLLRFPTSKVHEVDLNEKYIKTITTGRNVSGTELSVSIPRFGIRTFLIEQE